MRGVLSLPQIDRVRWNLFREVRVPDQGALFDDADEQAAIPDFLRVKDLQQEQLARSLGEGHRVIHGVAGSGKTTILGYRAEFLAKAATDVHKPVLVLCTRQILQTASAMATELLRRQEKDDDGAPLLHPVSCGRDGPEPIVIDCPAYGRRPTGLPSSWPARTTKDMPGATWRCCAAAGR